MRFSKYTEYDSNFSDLEQLQTDWDWGDQSLDLDPKQSWANDISSLVAETAVGVLGWYGRILPVPYRVFGYLILSKDQDVRDALADRDRFKVPFGREMNLLAGPPVFGLGDDANEHALQRDIMIKIIKASDTASLGNTARDVANALLEDGQGNIDAVHDLIKPVLAEICFDWYGLIRVDPHAFMSWSNAVSTLIFGTPAGASELDQRRALEGARRLKALIHQTLAQPDTIPADSILGRLLALRDQNQPVGPDGIGAASALTDARIVSILVGMISGSAPTTLMAAAHTLRRVLRWRFRTFQARTAARKGNDETMLQIVRECMRMRPATWPGVFRRVDLSGRKPPVFAGRHLRHSETVMVAVSSALRDPRVWSSPHRYYPARMSGTPGHASPAPDLAFGMGAHDCVGRWVAEDVTTAIMMAIFSQASVRRKSMMRAKGVFPSTLPIRYAAASGIQAQEMLVAAIPLNYNVQARALAAELAERALSQQQSDTGERPSRAARRMAHRHAAIEAEKQVGDAVQDNLRAALDALDGNPVKGAIKQALRDTGLVHTHSMSLANMTKRGKPHRVLLVEYNVDGPRGHAIAKISAALTPLLTDVIDALGYKDMSLGYLFSRFMSHPLPRLRGHSGVSFNGVPEWSIPQIEAERKMAKIVEKVIDDLHANPPKATPHNTSSALRVLAMARAKIHADATLRRHLFRTTARAPAFAKHTERTFPQAIKRWLCSRTFVVPATITVLAFFVIGYLIANSLGAAGFVQTSLLTLGMTLLSIIAVATPIALIVFLALRKLRRQEATDLIDNRYVPLQQHLDAAQNEDSEKSEQNHFIAVNTLKPGILRRMLMSFGFRLIAEQAIHWFRPGFVLDLGTIRHARWLRVKGTDQLIFQANFDGSWERYLEDFSDKVAKGQTLIWSNCEGYPKTSGFYNEGATDGERFKRWVRGRQVKTNLWYSRFTKMTNDRIRRNALISDGLARALTREQAEKWLRLFGSSPRNRPNVLETDEIQSIVFNTFSKQKTSACIGMGVQEPKAFKHALAALLDTDHNAVWGKLPPLKVSFGTTAGNGNVATCTIGFSATGLVRLGLPSQKSGDTTRPVDFPLSYVKGMRRQARVLGDPADYVPEWTDIELGNDDTAIDVVILLTVPDADLLPLYREALIKLFGTAISASVMLETSTPNKPAKPGADPRAHARDTLGFRDGISQPLLLGMPGVKPDHPDAIKPGEFVLGYKDERDLVGPSPHVPAAWDTYHDLPDAGPHSDSSWPDFAATPKHSRDFGRNGTYLVLRQLEELSQEFRTAMLENSDYIAADWAAEKAVGKQRGGAPLDHCPPGDSFLRDWKPPSQATAKPKKAADNISFNGSDPHGLQTPLGSHVRRANPKDSLDGGATLAPGRNRHRLLRRGRRYVDGNHSGLLFGCLNASIERQFEFVQQTWINSTSFHGLWKERDPLLASTAKNRFSVPTKHGRVALKLKGPFVKYRGGGYFFIPSRAALTALSRPRPGDT